MKAQDLFSKGYSLVVGVTGGAAIEATDQLDTLAHTVAPDFMGDGNPADLVKLITQLIIAVLTVISLFKRPKLPRSPKEIGYH